MGEVSQRRFHEGPERDDWLGFDRRRNIVEMANAVNTGSSRR